MAEDVVGALDEVDVLPEVPRVAEQLEGLHRRGVAPVAIFSERPHLPLIFIKVRHARPQVGHEDLLQRVGLVGVAQEREEHTITLLGRHALCWTAITLGLDRRREVARPVQARDRRVARPGPGLRSRAPVGRTASP